MDCVLVCVCVSSVYLSDLRSVSILNAYIYEVVESLEKEVNGSVIIIQTAVSLVLHADSSMGFT